MSSTNCLLPNNGFCLNFRVRMVNSLIALRWRSARSGEGLHARGARVAGGGLE